MSIELWTEKQKSTHFTHFRIIKLFFFFFLYFKWTYLPVLSIWNINSAPQSKLTAAAALTKGSAKMDSSC